MQKILISTGLYPPDIGGPATYAKTIADGLKSDYDVKVLAYSRFLRAIPQPFRFILFFIKTYFASRKAEIIYSLSPISTGIAAALMGKKLFVRVAGDRAWEDAALFKKTSLVIDDFQKIKDRGFKHKMQVWVCKKAEKVIVPSKYLENLVAGWGIKKEKIKIVHNSCNKPQFSKTKEEIRKELGLQGNIIVSVGRLVPWKGFRMLIKLLPKFLEINSFFKLVIVGDGPDMQALKSIAKNMNLQNKVVFAGKKSQEETAKYIRASDIFILNSGYEGFSHQIIEAMSIGIPVIVSNAGGNREIIKQGENGFIVKYNDEFNIVEAVKTLWQNPDLREKFVAAGHATASQYTPERTTRETKETLSG